MKAADRSGARLALIVGQRRARRRRRHRPPVAGRARRAAPRAPARHRQLREGANWNERPRPHCAPTTAASCAPPTPAQPVAVCGWVARRREHGEHLAFVDLRDHTGLVQCVVDGAHDLRSEYVVRVTGTVRARPEGTVNPNLATGEVEVGDCTVEVLSVAEPPPFPIDARADDVDEAVRLSYRYLDLRRERMQRNLRIRAAVNAAIRRAHGAAGLRRGRDADAHAVDAGGRPRVPRAVPAVARLVLRAAAEPAALQAAADGRRHRPLLPDRPLPPRRGPARRPPVRVHAARRRSELRRPGRRARRHRRGRARRRRGRDGRAAGAHRAHDVARGHGPLRRRQARPALRHGARRADAAVRRHRVQGVRPARRP